MAHGIFLLDGPGLHHPVLPTHQPPIFHANIRASFSDPTSQPFQARMCAYVGQLLEAVPPKERACWSPGVVAVLEVAAGVCSVPGRVVRLGSAG